MRERWMGLVLLLSVAACDNAGEGRVLAVEASGAAWAWVFFDQDGGQVFTQNDTPMSGVGVRLVAKGTRDTVARVVTGQQGRSEFPALPVGTYLVVVETTTFGDTISVVKLDSTEITVRSRDTVEVLALVSYPRVTVAEARELEQGRKVFVEGVALNNRQTFGDNTVHLRDTTRSIRGTRVRTTPFFFVGDSVRFLGVRAVSEGQPTLDDVQVFWLRTTDLPVPDTVTTAEAALADGGLLDAALVRVIDATVGDTSTVAGDYLVTVDDGSGPLVVVFDQDAPVNRGPWVPDVVGDFTGVLVPTGEGGWRLKPRANADLLLKP